MKRNFMNQPLARPLTPREKGIRTKYGALFVLAVLTALITGVYYNKLDMENTELKRNFARFDSLYVKADYVPDSNMDVKIVRVFDDAMIYREIHDDLFELKVTNGRYEMALEYYLDPLMHEELRERTGYKSKFTQQERIKFVNEIKDLAKDCNMLVSYMYACDIYKEQYPAAVKDIEQFFFFTE